MGVSDGGKDDDNEMDRVSGNTSRSRSITSNQGGRIVGDSNDTENETNDPRKDDDNDINDDNVNKIVIDEVSSVEISGGENRAPDPLAFSIPGGYGHDSSSSIVVGDVDFLW